MPRPHVTTDPFGNRAYSTGEIFLPWGTMPRSGWPVVSWAHGTSGLGDACAPSRIGPALRERDFYYLRQWLKQGYAIVASDYVGLGTPGLMPYLDGRTTAHSVVDMVKAGRRFGRAHLPASQQLTKKWVVIGKSQGGGAAIYTARWATKYGGPGLDYRGAVGTGTPAYIEDYVFPARSRRTAGGRAPGRHRAYAGVLEANQQPVDFHAYPTGDHNTTLKLSLPDSVPFVRARFR